MSSRGQHFREAERILADHSALEDEFPLTIAAIHAQLATMGDTAYREYLDLLSMEHAREEVAATPEPISREWIFEEDEDA